MVELYDNEMIIVQVTLENDAMWQSNYLAHLMSGFESFLAFIYV